MFEVYEDHGVHFEYPHGWELTEQEGPREVFLTVSGPETSYWSLTLFFDRPGPERVLDTALDALRDEYDELDVYPVAARLAGRECLARDVEFVCLELINGAFLRACRTGGFTALVLYQATDHELRETRPLLEQITGSLQFDAGDDVRLA